MKLSIVATLYQSAPYVNEFYERVTASAKQLVGDNYEIVLVNDGSPDDSLEMAIQLTEQDSHIVVVDLSRNFGHHRAIIVGLENSVGENVFLIDVDLEEPPELLLDFWEELILQGSDCVYGVQDQRKGNFFEVISGHIFYKLFNYLSDFSIPENTLVAKLMTKDFVNALVLHKERSVFLGGITALVGFKQSPFVCNKKSKGVTSYTLSKKVEQFVDSVTSFSAKPLYYVLVIGVLVFISAFIFAMYLVARRILNDSMPDGWASLIVIMLSMTGLIILSVGVVGIYISKIFEEVKGRPYAIIKKIKGRS